MERKPQSTATPLIQALGEKLPYVNFYRFCQLLEKNSPELPELGSSHDPKTDPIRFRPHRGMGFPATEIKGTDPLDKYRKSTIPSLHLPFWDFMVSHHHFQHLTLTILHNIEMVRIH
ncbi:MULTISPECIES: type VI secretion system baseplate subunit TssG [Proteus]|uniref:type VI secretion system baseplate subunit TssG n=1 Tax=Proteus sp. CA142267 TaxID=2050965 RepID=UPI002094723D|nr:MULTISPECIES: type VI secretion system baseplate subunit TssG [Proteus]